MNNMVKFNKFKLNENMLNNDDLTFSSKLEKKEVSIDFINNWEKVKQLNLNEDDNFDIESSLNISWKLDLEFREWGVKNINQEILNVIGIINLSVWKEDDSDEEHQIKFDNSIENFKISIEHEEKSTTIMVQSINIDFSMKLITVYF